MTSHTVYLEVTFNTDSAEEAVEFGLKAGVWLLETFGVDDPVDIVGTVGVHLQEPTAPVATAIVVQIDGGAIHCARASVGARVVILDRDCEGGDAENIATINGERAYITDLTLTEGDAEAGHGGIAPDFVAAVLAQVAEAFDPLAHGYRIEGPSEAWPQGDLPTAGRYWWTLIREGWSSVECGDEFDTHADALADAQRAYDLERASGEVSA